jgi:hypothetical protein
VPSANSAAPAHARTVQPIGSNRLARQAGNPSPALGRGPSGSWPRIVRAYVESSATGSQCSDWRQGRRQHTFWRLRWGNFI